MSATRARIRMTDVEVEEFLHQQWAMVLGTIGPTGFPHLVTLGYGFHDGALAFSSFAKAQKIVNLQRDPRLTVLVEINQAEYSAIQGVQIRGRAEFVTGPTAVLAVARSVIEQRAQGRDEPGLTSSEQTAMEALPRVATKRIVVKVVPEKVMSWDHRRLDGRY